jgi:hypothetical protein
MPQDRPRQPSPCDVLGARPGASDRDITRACRRLARAWPGRGDAGRVSAEVRLVLLAEPVRAFRRDDGNWPW